MCSVCCKTYHKKYHKDRCERKHSRCYRYFCSYEGCDKGFVEKGQLERHLWVHTGECPHQCNICGRMFKEKSSLTTHTRAHTGETPYECKLCLQKFKFLSTRDNHKYSRVKI